MVAWRFAVAAAMFAGTAGAALAQPPGPGDRAPFERNPRKIEGQPGNPAEMLERQLQELRARTAEVEAQLKKLRSGEGGPRESRPMPPEGPMGPGRPGFGAAPGGFGPRGPFGPGGPMGPGGPPFEQMSPEQIKQLIVKLQGILEAKMRGGESRKPDQPKKPDADKKPEGDKPKAKGAPSTEDVLRRLDQINKELDEIRRSLKK